MFYLWLIPLGSVGGFLVLALYLQLRGPANRVTGDEDRSPLDLAKEQEALEDAEEERKIQAQNEREAA